MTDQQQVKNWKSILWQEWATCNDAEYAQRLFKSVAASADMDLEKNPSSASRPLLGQVEAALYTACTHHLAAGFIWKKPLKQLEQAQQKTISTKILIDQLFDHHWLKRFLARHILLHQGTEIFSLLQATAQNNRSVKKMMPWLIQSICADTSQRLSQTTEQWVCPLCFTRCGSHWFDRRWLPDWAYYGCRTCRRSHPLLYCPQGIAVVLDNSDSYISYQQDDVLYTNWPSYRQYTDFDWVEIIKATDEEVERFAVHVGNDTDDVRQPRYKTMTCYLSPTCQLSLNTQRILENTFGQVIVNDN